MRFIRPLLLLFWFTLLYLASLPGQALCRHKNITVRCANKYGARVVCQKCRKSWESEL